MRKAQLEITELKENLRVEKLKYTELEQNYKSLKRSARDEKLKGKEKDRAGDPILRDNDSLIALHARRFGVMSEIFVSKDVFLQPRPSSNSYDLDRWDTEENMKRCIIAELYEQIPASLHDMLEKTSTLRDLVQYYFNKF